MGDILSSLLRLVIPEAKADPLMSGMEGCERYVDPAPEIQWPQTNAERYTLLNDIAALFIDEAGLREDITQLGTTCQEPYTDPRFSGYELDVTSFQKRPWGRSGLFKRAEEGWSYGLNLGECAYKLPEYNTSPILHRLTELRRKTGEFVDASAEINCKDGYVLIGSSGGRVGYLKDGHSYSEVLVRERRWWHRMWTPGGPRFWSEQFFHPEVVDMNHPQLDQVKALYQKTCGQ